MLAVTRIDPVHVYGGPGLGIHRIEDIEVNSRGGLRGSGLGIYEMEQIYIARRGYIPFGLIDIASLTVNGDGSVTGSTPEAATALTTLQTDLNHAAYVLGWDTPVKVDGIIGKDTATLAIRVARAIPAAYRQPLPEIDYLATRTNDDDGMKQAINYLAQLAPEVSAQMKFIASRASARKSSHVLFWGALAVITTGALVTATVLTVRKYRRRQRLLA